MGFTYQTRKKAAETNTHATETPISKSEMLHLSGAGAPQAMSPALREKFEPSFNADFSNIRISRGRIPDELGVQAVAKGTDILLDSRAGMDVLGHELAHVVQQAQGQVQGGFPVVENAALEHQADVMGARAASGLSAGYGGGEAMSIAPMTSASAPAQCKSKAEKAMDKEDKRYKKAISGYEKDKSLTNLQRQQKLNSERGAHGKNLADIVENMSEKDLHNKKVQQRVMGIAASSYRNATNDTATKRDNWGSYTEPMRNKDGDNEQRAFGMMMKRLIGLDQIRAATSKVTNGNVENAMGDINSLISGNDEVMDLLLDYQDACFGDRAPAFMTPELQSAAVMNNLSNRSIGPATMPTSAEKAANQQINMSAVKNSGAITKNLAVNPITGVYEKDSAGGSAFLNMLVSDAANRRRRQRGNR